jgi:hypothetical protein
MKGENSMNTEIAGKIENTGGQGYRLAPESIPALSRMELTISELRALASLIEVFGQGNRGSEHALPVAGIFEDIAGRLQEDFEQIKIIR